jgi:hypothetical protein
MRGKTKVGVMESKLYGKIVHEQAPSVKLIKGQTRYLRGYSKSWMRR